MERFQIPQPHFQPVDFKVCACLEKLGISFKK